MTRWSRLWHAAPGFIFVGLLAVSILGCGSSKPTLTGRFHQGPDWIEFASDGQVRHGVSGDTARFTVEGDRVVVSDGTQQTTGRLTASNTVEFPGGATRVAEAFNGTWVARVETATGGPAPAPAAAVDSKALHGEWGAPGDPGNLIFKPDGTFQWGSTVGGTYVVLDSRRVRMTFVHSGRPSGQADNFYAVQGILLRLEMKDGTKVVYERVK
jgi:hypothetical protein